MKIYYYNLKRFSVTELIFNEARDNNL